MTGSPYGAVTGELATSGSQNNAHGYQAGQQLKTGSNNCYLGANAGLDNVYGSNNSAFGATSLQNATGGSNTAIGAQVLTNLTTGASITALGCNAGNGATTNTQSTVDTNCLFLGSFATRDNSIAQSTVLTNMTVLGTGATGNQSNAVFLGNSAVTQMMLGGIMGIQISFGTAAPSAAPPGGAGLYIKVGGAVGASLYNYSAGAWHAVASV